jgi:hypothetical protein
MCVLACSFLISHVERYISHVKDHWTYLPSPLYYRHTCLPLNYFSVQ